MDVGPARLTTWLLCNAGQRIEIIHFSEPPPTRRAPTVSSVVGLSHMTVVIADADGTYDELLAVAGADPVVTDGLKGRSVVFYDPDGHVIRGVPEPLRW